MKVVIYNELSKGGIADYAHCQALALAERGVEVELLCSGDFLQGRDTSAYKALPVLKELRPLSPSRARILRHVRFVTGIVSNWRTLMAHVRRTGARNVLTHFSEYMAPLWASSARAAAREGVRFYSVLHDPVRNHVVGPRPWHERSVRDAFSFLTGVFVHSAKPDAVPGPGWVRSIPHGIYAFPEPGKSREGVRRELGIPADARVMIAFGYIRDNKNLDLVLEAMRGLDLYLIVAGSEQAGGNKPAAWYKDKAASEGVADRCRWVNRFLATEEVADLIGASDLAVLTYSKSFVSASAAFSVTAHYRIPCIVSSGSDTMRDQVLDYGIGVWVEPDSAAAIRAGLEAWLANPVVPDWSRYHLDNSWARNAELVEAAMREAQDAPGAQP